MKVTRDWLIINAFVLAVIVFFIVAAIALATQSSGG